jgi:hypothetical protein
MRLQKGGLIRIKIKQNKSSNKKNNQFRALHKAVHFCFTEIAKQNKWSAKDVNKALDEYFSVTANQKKKSSEKLAKQGGSGDTLYPTLTKYLQWMHHGLGWGVELMVGTFDTPCNTIISLIAIGTWCVVIYNMVNNVSPNEARHSLAQPVQYVIYNKAPELYTIEENITQHMINYLDNNVSSRYQALNSVVDSTTIVNTVRTIFWESNLYKLFIVKPLSCLLMPFITSCSKICTRRSRKRSSSKSTRRSSTSKRSSKSTSKRSSKSTSKRSSTSTKYYTPKEE